MFNKLIEKFKDWCFGKPCWELRVVKHGESFNFYCIEFKTRELGGWTQITFPHIFTWTEPEDDYLHFPYIATFDKCVARAKTIKSYEEYLKEYNEKLAVYTKRHNERLLAEKEKMDRSWYS